MALAPWEPPNLLCCRVANGPGGLSGQIRYKSKLNLPAGASASALAGRSCKPFIVAPQQGAGHVAPLRNSSKNREWH